jgi:hypothetical protein
VNLAATVNLLPATTITGLGCCVITGAASHVGADVVQAKV